MYYLKSFCLLSLFLVTMQVSVFSQTRHQQKVLASPSSSNFSYPQSLFVDSPSGQIWVTDFSNNRVLRFDVSTLASVDKTHGTVLPGDFFLGQNYPNPFNPATSISFSVKKTSRASLVVYNLLGQHIATLFNDVATANTVYSIAFNANNLPGGIYFYSLHTANGNAVKKMCLLK